MNKVRVTSEVLGLGLAFGLVTGCSTDMSRHDQPQSKPVRTAHSAPPAANYSYKVAQVFHVGKNYEWLHLVDHPGPDNECVTKAGDKLDETTAGDFIYRARGPRPGTPCNDGARVLISAVQAEQQDSAYHTTYQDYLQKKAMIGKYLLHRVEGHKQHSIGTHLHTANGQWITVRNTPEPAFNGNGTDHYGDACVAGRDGLVGTVGTLPDGETLDVYTIQRQTYGTDCGDHTYFIAK